MTTTCWSINAHTYAVISEGHKQFRTTLFLVSVMALIVMDRRQITDNTIEIERIGVFTPTASQEIM